MAKIMYDENQCELVCMSLEEYRLIREIIGYAETFSKVRCIEGYDDRADKSAGEYLSEAVDNFNNK